jgi:hypothetical protein
VKRPARRAAVAARYRVRVLDGVTGLPLGDWSRACAVAPGVFMDAGFLAAVEHAFGARAPVRPLLVYDADDRPQAWAAACAFPVDLAALAGPRVQSAARRVRAALPRLGCAKVLFLGLPVSLGQSHLAIAPEADGGAVLAVLDATLLEIAARERAWLVAWKEIDADAAARLHAPLAARGYRRAESPPMHELDARFADLSGYCAALTAHYRADVRRSRRKFDAAGLHAAHVDDAGAILRLYTPDVHRLYEAVVARAAVRLERLPLEFFHALVRRFPDRVELTVVHEGDRIVAFNWGMRDGRVYRFLFCGLDHAAARDADLYFNLMYHQLDRALRAGAERIEVGQTADGFKARLGCRPVPRYVYVKPRHPLARPALRWAFPLLFPHRPPPQPHAVFRA